MIDASMLAATADIVVARGGGGAALAQLRETWPERRFVACSEDDIPARLRPAFEGKGFNLYLIGGGEHCLALTTEAEAAIGIVIAEVVED